MNYNNNKLTAPNQNPLGYKDVPVGRSAVNKSRTIWNQGIIGACMPIDCIKTYPNSDTEISYDALITSRYPLVRELKTPIRAYLHSYLCYDRNVWEGAKRHVDAGLNGNITVRAPRYFYMMTKHSSWDWKASTLKSIFQSTTPGDNIVSTLSLYSPLAYMEGLVGAVRTPTITPTPIRSTFYKNQFGVVEISNGGVTPNDTTIITPHYNGDSNSTMLNINALKLAHYVRICRDYYFNTNLLFKNKDWYPDDEEEFMLPYDNQKAHNWNTGTDVSAEDFMGYVNRLNKSHPLVFGTSNRIYHSGHVDNGAMGLAAYVPNNNYYDSIGTTNISSPMLNALYFRQFDGDYFTSASPFKDLIRGNAPILNFDFNDQPNDLFSPPSTPTPNVGIETTGTYANTFVGTSSTNTALNNLLKKIVNHTSIDMSRLRKLQVMQTFAESNATINQADYYNGFIKKQFGYSANSDEKKPIYIGGCYFDIINNGVVNQSLNSTNTPNPNQPNYLGQKTSNLISANSGYIGKVHADDFGYIITIMTIVPQTIYANGLDRELNIIQNEDIFLPIKEKLDPMPIFNREIYVSGSASNDDNIFGYTARYEYAKGRRNRANGLAKVLTYDKAQFIFRNFSASPTLNNYWVTMHPNAIDTQYVFQNDVEPPFDMQINCNVDQVLPMSYTSQPSNLGL